MLQHSDVEHIQEYLVDVDDMGNSWMSWVDWIICVVVHIDHLIGVFNCAELVYRVTESNEYGTRPCGVVNSMQSCWHIGVVLHKSSKPIRF